MTDAKMVLNPGSNFPLTFYNVDKNIMRKMVMLLEEGKNKGYRAQSRPLVGLIAETGLRCKEIDDYILEFKPRYLNKIEELKNSTEDWNTASERDKKRLLREFREEAVESLDIIPACNLERLFEDEDKDAIALLIAATYTKTADTSRMLRELKGFESIIKHFEIGTSADGPCPHCEQMAEKKYSFNDLPKFPLHIGCRCSLQYICK